MVYGAMALRRVRASPTVTPRRVILTFSQITGATCEPSSVGESVGGGAKSA